MTDTYLVTGGAGFIGSNIVEKLVKEGNKVRVIDNLSTGKLENLKEVINDIVLIKGDIRDRNKIHSATKDVDYVLHHAGIVDMNYSINNPIETNEVNATGTMSVVKFSKMNNVKKIVVASSSAVYGDCTTLPIKENVATNPKSPYAKSKLLSEKYCMDTYKLGGLPIVCLRYFNVFGKNQNADSPYSAVIPKFIKQALNNETLQIFGTGEQTRDFIHIDNIVNANLLAVTNDNSNGEIFNVGSGNSISILELISIIEKLLDIKLNIEFEESRTEDIEHSQADISKIKEMLGYEEQISFLEGLEKLIYEHISKSN